MSRGSTGWWGIRRGSFHFTVQLESPPVVLPGDAVWWMRDDSIFCGAVSARPKPIGVLDVAHLLNLPASPLTDEHWVLVSEGAPGTWALVSDIEPKPLEELHEEPLPWLPTATARRLVKKLVVSEDVSYLVIEPAAWTEYEAPSAEEGVGEQRVKIRLARLSAVSERVDMEPSLVATRVGSGWWGLRAEDVHMVVQVRHITPLPGAQPIVWGLTTITGRVNVIVDPSRVLEAPSISLPCWVAEVQAKGAKWGVAAAEEWQVFSAADVRPVEDHTPPPGPPGLVVQRMRYGDDTVLVLSLEKLGELAKGERSEALP